MSTHPDPITLLTPEAVVEQLRVLRQQIPNYSQLTTVSSQRLRAAAAAEGPFLQASINAIGASPIVRTAVGRTPDELRVEADEASRWTAVEDELRAMLKGVVAANLMRRHRLGLTALQTYNISRQLVRKEEHADLLPHVAEMQRLNRFGRRRKVAPPEGQVKPAAKPA